MLPQLFVGSQAQKRDAADSQSRWMSCQGVTELRINYHVIL
jgi:hypothetical protein